MSDDNNDSDDNTQIQVQNSTTDRLKKRGNKGETYDDVINRLLDETEPEDGE